MTKLINEDILDIELELTGTCNLSCPLCARNYTCMSGVGKNIRPLSEWIHQLDTYPNVKSICLAGIMTEPTLYPEFIQLLEYINSRNISLELYSNASIHDTDWWYKLGEVVSCRTKVFFTVCGTTQELHEKYRVGSKLQKVLDNAKAFRAGCKEKKNDYLQHIMFEYNKEDFKTEAMDDIRKSFSNEKNIYSLPYRQRFELKGNVPDDIELPSETLKKYKAISSRGKRQFEKGGACVNCKSFNTKFISIDQYGGIAPCFLYRLGVKDKWNLDYDKIHKAEHDFCYECEALTSEFLTNTDTLDVMA